MIDWLLTQTVTINFNFYKQVSQYFCHNFFDIIAHLGQDINWLLTQNCGNSFNFVNNSINVLLHTT